MVAANGLGLGLRLRSLSANAAKFYQPCEALFAEGTILSFVEEVVGWSTVVDVYPRFWAGPCRYRTAYGHYGST